MDPNKQITETLKELLAEMNAMKTTLPSSELRIIQLSMEEFKHAQSDMKKDLSKVIEQYVYSHLSHRDDILVQVLKSPTRYNVHIIVQLDSIGFNFFQIFYKKLL
mgnify:CR=1 FL=1